MRHLPLLLNFYSNVLVDIAASQLNDDHGVNIYSLVIL